ncbi:MAG TPA: DoxX family protein [Steroidobacteraceae bacterium]|jgi:putative oxidoreductase|nr:DoxX family protein [Steroidobacteraceae bacterium]
MFGLAGVLDRQAQFARMLEPLRAALLLGTRLWVSWQFLKSGWLKLTTWDVTLELFRSEYQVPLLPPEVAAVAGTFGELVFPLLLIPGLLARPAALGLSAVNLMAVVSYWHVLGSEGFEAALGQHVLWGYMLAVIVLFGAGAISVDRRLSGRGMDS